jgi:predicted CoA-binding protein
MSNKTTVVIGASDNPDRYAYKAIMSLTNKGHLVYAEGQRKGIINDAIHISIDRKPYKDIDTVTLYVGAKNQPNWYEYILSLKPKRIIFNPGTENEELMQLAHNNHIETIEACTLVMLSIDNY